MADFPFELNLEDTKTMYRTRSRLLIEFKGKMLPNQIGRLLEPFNLVLETGATEASSVPSPRDERINHTEKRFWVKSANNTVLFAENVNALESKMKTVIEWIAPVYRIDGPATRQEYLCPLPNVLMIKPHCAESAELLRKLFWKYAIKESVSESNRNDGYLHCSIADPKLNSSYKMMSIFQYLSDVRFECIPMMIPATESMNSYSIENERIPELSAGSYSA